LLVCLFPQRAIFSSNTLSEQPQLDVLVCVRATLIHPHDDLSIDAPDDGDMGDVW